MHAANMEFWRQTKAKYPYRFTNSKVIEVGSYDVNGTVRALFENCDYTGLDWRPGPGVDVVSLAHEYNTVDQYDVVISASMLEHDPYWDASLVNMLNLMKDDGILLLSWGGGENQEHCNEAAPDGAFHALPVARVLEKLDEVKAYVHEFRYEENICATGTTPGGVALIAFKDKTKAFGPRWLDELHPLDR